MTLRQWLNQDPFTLSLSSGFFGFFAHAGLASVLEEENLFPERITGCSAGALTGVLWAAGKNVHDMLDFYQSVKKESFWDPGFGLGLLKGRRFRELLAANSPVQRLEECQVPVSVSVYDMNRRKNKVFQTGPIPEIVYASCAIPPLFQPVRIDGKRYWDGAFTDTPGMAGVPDGSRVFYHHLESRSKRKNQKDYLKAHRDRLEIVEVRIPNIPRVNPNRLEMGGKAFEHVQREFRKLLDSDASPG